MILLNSLTVHNYRSAKGKLDGLRDINIVIGPNNCGKTNLLEAINILPRVHGGRATGAYSHCPQCAQLFQANNDVIGVSYSLQPKEKFLEQQAPTLALAFDENALESIWPVEIQKLRKLLSSLTNHAQGILTLKGYDSNLMSEHISICCSERILNELKNAVLYLPEGRLQIYRGKAIREYLMEKKLKRSQSDKLFHYLKRMGVNTKISDYDPLLNLTEETAGKEFVSTLDEQGSGVRSMVCLIADMLTAGDSRIILMDEPELGLNPHSKQEFLKILLEFSQTKQIFLTTHDPTFLNPVLWRDDRVSAFLYSVLEEGFVKIDLNQSAEDPETFAGYLPHTVSLKNVHLYVEGSSDAYIFQIFLRKYLKSQYPRNWIEILNRVGIFHLAGSFWRHLLNTVPESPYRRMVVLDGNKRDDAEKVCQHYIKAGGVFARFEFITDIGQLENALKSKKEEASNFAKVPVYCLQKPCIEEYLEPKRKSEDPHYNKRIDGPNRAEDMDKVPEEISRIFGILLQ